MSLLDNAIAKIEKTILESMSDRLEITTEVDAGTLTLHTTTTWDGIEVARTDFDMEPLVDAIAERMAR